MNEPFLVTLIERFVMFKTNETLNLCVGCKHSLLNVNKGVREKGSFFRP